MAGGGLVAFADGGLSDLEFPTTFSPEDIAYGEQYGEGYRKAFDPEAYYSKRAKQIEEMEAMGPEELEQQKGLAALQAAAAMSQGSDFTRGLGGALGAFGETYGTAVKEANKEKRALAQMQAEMEDARRKEEAALYKDTRAATQEAYGRRTEQAKFNLDVAKARAELAAQREQNAAAIAAAAAKGQKDPSDWKFTYQEQLDIVYPDIRAEVASDPANKGRTEKELDILATRRAQDIALTKTSKLLGKDLSEVKAALQAGNLGVNRQKEAAEQALQLALLMGDTYVSAPSEQQAQIIESLTNQILARQSAAGAGFLGVGPRPADAVRLRQPAQ